MTITRYLAIGAIASLSLFACSDDGVETGEEQNITQKSGGQVELYRSEADGQYRFRVKAANGEIILVSEAYKGKAGAMNGVESVNNNGRSFDNFELLPASNNPDASSTGEWYFVLKAGNGQVIGVGENYSSKSGAKTGAKTVVGYVLGGLALDNWADMCGFEIYVGSDDQLYFRLRAHNGEKMVRSEGYTSEANAKNGVDSVLENGRDTANYEVNPAATGGFYFNLVAGNGQVIATSESYTTEAAANDAVAVVQGLVGEQSGCTAQATGTELECGYDIASPITDDSQVLEEDHSTDVLNVDAGNLSDLSDLQRDQVRVAIQYQTEEFDTNYIEGADGAEVWLHQVDYNGTGYDWVQFYLGDTEVGVVFDDDTYDIVALIGDGDIYGCR